MATLSFPFSHTCSSHIVRKIVASPPRNAAVGDWNVASTALVVMRYRSTVPFVRPVVIVSQTCTSLLRFPLFLNVTVPGCVHFRLPTQKPFPFVCELGAGGTGVVMQPNLAQPNIRRYMIMTVLINMRGTMARLAQELAAYTWSRWRSIVSLLAYMALRPNTRVTAGF